MGSYEDFEKFITPLLEKEEQNISSLINESQKQFYEEQIELLKFYLERIITTKLFKEYSDIKIYETALENEVLKKINEIFRKKEHNNMTKQEEYIYEEKLREVNPKRNELEKKIQKEIERIKKQKECAL